MAKLTDTQLVILSAASQRDDRGVELSANVQDKTTGKVVAKLIRAGLLEEVRASGSLPVWRCDDESGAIAIALRITSAGLAAIDTTDEGIAAPEENDGRLANGEVARSAGGTASRKQMSVSAQTSARKRHRPGKAKTQTGSLHGSRPGSKQARVLAMLGRPEGATIAPSCGRPIGSSIRCAAFSPVWCARNSASIFARRRATVTGFIASSTPALFPAMLGASARA